MKSFKDKILFQTELTKLIGNEVDIVFLQEVGGIISFQIFKRGQVIFERDNNFHRFFRATKIIQCLDFKFFEGMMQKGMIEAMKRGE